MSKGTVLWVFLVTMLASTAALAGSHPVFGIIRGRSADSDMVMDYNGSGIRAITFELAWSSYEPVQGKYDSRYIKICKVALQELRRRGLIVCLEPGLHYTPDWVFSLSPNARFVNQYGDTWTSTQIGNNVPNSVFDPAVRKAQASYIERIGRDFRDVFGMVRCGGLGYGELRYPSHVIRDHRNSYWCFDANAQSASPVPGWKPGEPSPAKAREFIRYYLDSIVDYQNWLIGRLRSSFPSAHIMVLYPSWGLRPGDVEAAVRGCLDGHTGPETTGELHQGTDFARCINSISDRDAWAYCTWMERASDGDTHRLESPIEYISYLARRKGIPVAGENAGDNNLTEMKTCIDRARSIPMAAMFWMSERQLGTGNNATLDDYTKLIKVP